MSLCAGHHEIHRSDDGSEVWVECDEAELNRLTVEDWAKATGLDVSSQIQLFIREVMFEHEQDVVGKVVIELLNRVESVGGFDSVYNRCEHGYMPLCPVSDHGIARP